MPAGCHDHSESLFIGIGGELIDVLAGHRFAAGEYEHGFCEFRNPVYEAEPLFSTEFVFGLAVVRRRPAVDAVQRAFSGRFPGHHMKMRKVFFF